MFPLKPTAILLGVTCALAVAPGAFASDIRPIGYLERGTWQAGEAEARFLPDAVAETAGGRYFRVGGFDETVFYGVGAHPVFDYMWPSHRTTPQLKELLRASPGSLSFLDRYEQGQDYAQNWGRMGMLITVGALAAAAGGFVYGAVPSNPREMAPSYFYVTGGVAALGLALFGTSTFIANDNQQLLDRAIGLYNRDMAGRRQSPQPILFP